MGKFAYLYSIVFFITGLVSLNLGFYMLKLNPKLKINRLYLFITLSLSIWALGFTMANIQSTAAAALFWRRFAALGWSSIFTIILHFFLLIRNKEKEDKSPLYRYRFFLYLPTIVMIYVFSLSSTIADIQYNLVQVNFGWTNQITNNVWDYFYYLYYLTYILLTIYVLLDWRKHLKENSRIMLASFVLTALFSAAFLGSIIDVVIPSYFPNAFPQIAPLLTLLPISVMYYSMRYHDLLDLKVEEREKILSIKEESQIFKSLAIVLFLGGILTFVFMFFSTQSPTNGHLINSIIQSSCILGLGMLILAVQKIKKDEWRERLSFSILLLSIPVITFRFFESSSTTVWVYSILIMMGSLLFDKRFFLIATTIITLLSQLLVWAFRSTSYIYLSNFNFALRILFILVAFALGSYVNRIYTARVKENKEQIRFLEIVSDITFDFLTFEEKNSEEKIQKLLQKTGDFFDIDRIYLFTINHAAETMTYSNEWTKKGIPKEIGKIKERPVKNSTWWFNQFKLHQLINLKNIEDLPAEAWKEKKELQRQGVKSLLSVPIMENGRIYAFIGIDSVENYKKWTSKEINLLQILANILKNVLTPIQIDKQTKFMAYNDGLTKLPNRFLFMESVNKAIHLAETQGNEFAVIFVDLDGFKAVNDSLGHSGGDILLKQVAKDLKEIVNEEDVVARFAGDEFLILLNQVGDQEALKKSADQIVDLFSKEFLVLNQEFIVTASLGIVNYLGEGETAESLIRSADMAMYQAKMQGKNQYVFCTQEMREKDFQQQQLAADLSQALLRDEFVIHYQPQVNLLTNEIVGLEALIRWNHPKKGLLSPGIFIPLAERKNLIDPIGDWVLKTVAIQAKKWQDMGLPHLKIAVNLSAAQIRNLGISKKIKAITKDIGLDPKYIELEITESLAIEKSYLILKNLNQIQDTGVSISIDDFGTEYSSLGRLKMLPVDQLKIDMQFIQAIEESEKDRAIITTIINLARKLNLSVIAEGVETAEQLDFLIEEECEYVQGYYFYRPMPRKDIEKILQDC